MRRDFSLAEKGLAGDFEPWACESHEGFEESLHPDKASSRKELANAHMKKGDRQTKIVAILLEKLHAKEVDKEPLVKFKTWLMSVDEENPV